MLKLLVNQNYPIWVIISAKHATFSFWPCKELSIKKPPILVYFDSIYLLVINYSIFLRRPLADTTFRFILPRKSITGRIIESKYWYYIFLIPMLYGKLSKGKGGGVH